MSAAGPLPLPSLPAHLAAEERCLRQAGIASWSALAALHPAQLRQLAAGGCSESRLRQLQGQAALMQELPLQPAEAALLLLAGVPSAQALARQSPEELLRALNRLERRLIGAQQARIDLARARGWVQAARRRLGRPPN